MFSVSVKLSKYLETGGSLSPQEAVIMTSSLSKSLGALYKLGLTTNIEPENIYMEHNENVSCCFLPLMMQRANICSSMIIHRT